MATLRETRPFLHLPPGDPSQVRRVHAQHHSIVRQVGELTRRLDEGPGTGPPIKWRAEIARRLSRLQNDLAEHFNDEENVGFIPRALAAAPRLSRRARAIASQHDLLRTELADVTSLAERKTTAWVEIRFGFQAFSASLGEHEERENELIDEAFMDDLGGLG